MSARLIWITPDAEKQLLFIARVSSNQDNTNPKLIRYLIDHKHWSPFESIAACVEIKTSRYIAQQILRHRSFAFQEFSQRYSVAHSVEHYKPRKQATNNRQSSIDDLDPEIIAWYENERFILYKQIFDFYNRALDKGIARECAREILPLATTTTLYMTGSIRSFIHYCAIRCDEHTQKEHRDIAEEIRRIVFLELPETKKALGW